MNEFARRKTRKNEKWRRQKHSTRLHGKTTAVTTLVVHKYLAVAGMRFVGIYWSKWLSIVGCCFFGVGVIVIAAAAAAVVVAVSKLEQLVHNGTVMGGGARTGVDANVQKSSEILIDEDIVLSGLIMLRSFIRLFVSVCVCW